MPDSTVQKEGQILDPNPMVFAPESSDNIFLQKLSVSVCVRESILQLTFQEIPQIYFLRRKM